MPTLKEILDELEIDTGEDQDTKPEDPKIDVDKLPEDQKKYFSTLNSELENLKNEVSKRDLAIGELQKAVRLTSENQNKQNNQDNKKEEKILGVLDPEDPYAPAFQKIMEAVDNVKQEIPRRDPSKEFQENIVKLAKENPDIVRYVKDMDSLLQAHPTYINDVEGLYQSAKAMSERRKSTESNKRKSVEAQGNAINFKTESSGMSNQNVRPPDNVKSISEAFNLAMKKSA